MDKYCIIPITRTFDNSNYFLGPLEVRVIMSILYIKKNYLTIELRFNNKTTLSFTAQECNRVKYSNIFILLKIRLYQSAG